MEERPSYFAIIPASVRYDERLPASAKLLYGEITALCNSNGYCWASNKYFAELYGVTVKSISLWLKALIDAGYIKSELIYKDGAKAVEKRYITITDLPIEKNFHTYGKKFPYPMEKKVKDNNTSINNTYNNKRKKDYKELERRAFKKVTEGGQTE